MRKTTNRTKAAATFLISGDINHDQVACFKEVQSIPGMGLSVLISLRSDALFKLKSLPQGELLSSSCQNYGEAH